MLSFLDKTQALRINFRETIYSGSFITSMVLLRILNKKNYNLMRKVTFFLFLVVGILSLNSYTSFAQLKQNTKQDIEDNPLKNALWIGDDKPLPKHDSLFYKNSPSPLFRKVIAVENNLKSATLYITAAGYYKATINGDEVGKNALDPAWTDYKKRIYFASYDVTQQIKKGTNCIGVTIGNGFYNPLPLKMWGRRNLRNVLAVGKPIFIAKLVLSYQNGKTEEIITDDSWKYSYGPILRNSVYLGVVYDANQEIEDWNKTTFNDKSWSRSKILAAPGGQLQKAFFPAVQITNKITPVKISSVDKNVYILDMGVNFTGVYRFKLSGKKGDTITFRFGERLYNDGRLNPMTTVTGQIKKKGTGGPGAPDIAWETDSYIIGKDGFGTFQPDFTFHTYRYMEVVGLKYKPQVSDIQGLVLHTNVESDNSFECSSELLNSIQKASQRTFLDNLISVQSDCPGRERFGYGGDLNAISESYIANFNMQSFYRKTVYDWVDAINDSTFVDTAPYVGVKYCGISWESAMLITQYYLYLYYNDTSLIKELYQFDNKWMDKVARIHPKGIVDEGLSDHGSMEPVPVQLTGTAHYLQCAEIMAKFATVVGDKAKSQEYLELAKKLRNLIKENFWDKPITGAINRQTLFSTLLFHNIVPQNEIAAAKDSLLKAINNGPSGHLNTGIFGTKYTLEAASKYISPSVIYNVVNSTTYPGWGFMIDKGATTIWETWEESESAFSNCHPMLASVSEWFYKWLGGIQPDENYPGFKKFILSPSTPEGLNFVNTKYKSPYGTIISNWKKNEFNGYTYEITIPKQSEAQVTININPNQKISIVKNGDLNFNKTNNWQTGKFNLKEGIYKVVVSSK